jgi:hypothetical protein
MIRVSVFSIDFMPQGAGPGYISLSMQRETLDQTDLRNMDMHPRKRWETDIATRMAGGAHKG